jgi:hypothetical protein
MKSFSRSRANSSAYDFKQEASQIQMYRNIADNVSGRSRNISFCDNMLADLKQLDLSKIDDYTTEFSGITTYGAALQIISTIIGGGIISVPYAMTTAGF